MSITDSKIRHNKLNVSSHGRGSLANTNKMSSSVKYNALLGSKINSASMSTILPTSLSTTIDNLPPLPQIKGKSRVLL